MCPITRRIHLRVAGASLRPGAALYIGAGPRRADNTIDVSSRHTQRERSSVHLASESCRAGCPHRQPTNPPELAGGRCARWDGRGGRVGGWRCAQGREWGVREGDEEGERAVCRGSSGGGRERERGSYRRRRKYLHILADVGDGCA